jgi:hypothetical protein
MSDYGHLACHQLDLLALPRTARAYGGSNCGKKRIDTEIFLYLRTSCINPLATSVSATFPQYEPAASARLRQFHTPMPVGTVLV